jgi:DNA-binding MarR family transcriptional regulator
VTEIELAERLRPDGRPVDYALRQLRLRSLVEIRDEGTIALTDAGRQDYERLVTAKCDGLRELLDGWNPEQHAELQQLVDRLGRDLVGEIPAPPKGQLAGIGPSDPER